MTPGPPVRLPGSEQLRLDGPSGPHRLWLWRPAAPPPPAGYPAVIVLDAEHGFATATDVLRAGGFRPGSSRVQPAALIGLAHEGDSPDRDRRARDYAPGAEALLGFLLGPAWAAAASRLPLDPARRSLFGHSLAGRFALEALSRRPDAFGGGAVAASPSVWRGRAELLAGIGAMPASSSRALVLVGEWEQALAPWESSLPDADAVLARRRERGMVDGAAAAAAALAARLGPGRARFECLAGENHGSMLAAGLGRGLRFLLAPDA